LTPLPIPTLAGEAGEPIDATRDLTKVLLRAQIFHKERFRGKDALEGLQKRAKTVSFFIFSIVFFIFSIEILSFSIEILSFFIEIMVFSIEILSFSIEILTFFIETLSFSIEILVFSIEKTVFFIVFAASIRFRRSF